MQLALFSRTTKGGQDVVLELQQIGFRHHWSHPQAAPLPGEMLLKGKARKKERLVSTTLPQTRRGGEGGTFDARQPQ